VLSDSGVSVKRLPTYFGTLNYSIRPHGDKELTVALGGDIALPPGRIVLPSPLEQPLIGVTINGRASRNFTTGEAVIDEFPATVVLRYGGAPAADSQGALNNTAHEPEDDGPAKPKEQHG
jgi:hypothetical protein